MKALLGYGFPGNICELQNLVERGVISADEGGVIDLPHKLRKEQLGDGALLSVGAHGALSDSDSVPAPSDAASLFERMWVLPRAL